MNAKVESISLGMVIAEDVFDKNGLLLVPKDTIVTEHIIMHLLKSAIFSIKVKDNWIQDINYSKFNEIYTQAISDVKSTFDSIKRKKNVELSDFENIVEELLTKSESMWSILPYIKLLEDKDEYTLRHSINVSITAMLMAKWLKYKKADIKLLGITAMLHDIGKIQIPNTILNKPGSLTDMEYNIMKSHTKLGFELLKKSGNDAVKNVALTHHERVNGKGYPFGLVGTYISQNAKIVAICDVYDAVTSRRVYKQKESPLKGLNVILDDSYNGLDPYLCKIFLTNVAMAYNGCKVSLNDGRIGKIINVPLENPSKPWVVINDLFYDLAKSSNLEVVDIL